jgi:hypothetical protein
LNTFGELNVATILIALAVVLVVFLIVREVLCWYWKVNQAIALLTEIRDLLASRSNALMSSSASATSSGHRLSSGPREPTL